MKNFYFKNLYVSIIAVLCVFVLGEVLSSVGTEAEEQEDILPIPAVVELSEVSSYTDESSIEEIVPPRYGFTDEEIYILAQLLCGDKSYDGDGEYDFVYGALHNNMRYDEMSKILCVIMNRVRHEDFPDTVSEVIFQSGQFADYIRVATEPSEIAIEKIREWCKAYDGWDPGVQNIPEDHLYYEAGENLTNITGEEW